MYEDLISGLYESGTSNEIALTDFLICIGSALAIGLILAGCYMYHTRYTKSFVVTLALLPAIVCVVIMMVNGNVGTGVAVAGAFSLVRFRSVPGTAKEIGAIFLAMGTGLVVGMGYIGLAFLFAAVVGFFFALYSRVNLGSRKKNNLYKTLRITIPEDLDYTDVFEPVLEKYATECELTTVKTTNMGSLFRLTYNLKLNSADVEKQMIDELRCRNGNLEISVSKQETATYEL